LRLAAAAGLSGPNAFSRMAVERRRLDLGLDVTAFRLEQIPEIEERFGDGRGGRTEDHLFERKRLTLQRLGLLVPALVLEDVAEAVEAVGEPCALRAFLPKRQRPAEKWLRIGKAALPSQQDGEIVDGRRHPEVVPTERLLSDRDRAAEKELGLAVTAFGLQGAGENGDAALEPRALLACLAEGEVNGASGKRLAFGVASRIDEIYSAPPSILEGWRLGARRRGEEESGKQDRRDEEACTSARSRSPRPNHARRPRRAREGLVAGRAAAAECLWRE
jgi:hypothetical protein